MKSRIGSLKYVFVGLLFIGSVSVTAYDLMITKPRAKCTAEGKWWSGKDRKCYAPVTISTFTGRETPKDAAKVPQN